METPLLAQIFFYLTILSGTLAVIGLIRPGFVVWWSEKKTRGNVMMVYGSILVVVTIGYWLTRSAKEGNPFNQGFKKTWQVRHLA